MGDKLYDRLRDPNDIGQSDLEEMMKDAFVKKEKSEQ